MMISQIELDRIRHILTLRYDPNEQSSIKNSMWQNWNPIESDREGNHIEDLLFMKIFDNLVSKDHVGIALSSGVDSSLVLAMIRNAFPQKKITAFHYTGVNNDELEASKNLAAHFEADFKILKPSPVFERIPKMIQMLDAPKWDAYDYIIPEAAKAHGCDILVTGDGSDELFAGYTFRYEKFLRLINPYNSGIEWINQNLLNYLECHNHDFVEDQHNLFVNFDWDVNITPHLWMSFSNPMGKLQQVVMADYNGKLLHNFLVKKEKFSKEFDIPIFSPFLDERIREYAMHLPFNEKYHNGTGKLQLRAICKRLGINPPSKKLGFTHDTKSEWKQYKIDYLIGIMDLNCLIYKLGIINYSWVDKNMDSKDERVINKLVSLYALESYLRWKN